MKTLEFCCGSHIRDAVKEAAKNAEVESVKFEFNGESYTFPQGTTVKQITQEYESRTNSKILTPETEKQRLEKRMQEVKEKDSKLNGHLIIENGSINKAPQTCSDALKVWDSGEYVVTASMGGLRAGYEICIQCLVFELIREFKNDTIPYDKKEGEKWWKTIGKQRKEDVVSKLDKQFSFSGSQCGVAVNLALCVLRRGYQNALSELPSDRIIRVRKPQEDHKLW